MKMVLILDFVVRDESNRILVRQGPAFHSFVRVEYADTPDDASAKDAAEDLAELLFPDSSVSRTEIVPLTGRGGDLLRRYFQRYHNAEYKMIRVVLSRMPSRAVSAGSVRVKGFEPASVAFPDRFSRKVLQVLNGKD